MPEKRAEGMAAGSAGGRCLNRWRRDEKARYFVTGRCCGSLPFGMGGQLGEDIDPADHAELAAELSACDGALIRVIQIGDSEGGNVTPTPLPPPVREGAV